MKWCRVWVQPRLDCAAGWAAAARDAAPVSSVPRAKRGADSADGSPASTPRFFPDQHRATAAGAHQLVVLQLHLHPSGKAEQERGRIAIYFAKTPPQKSMTGVQVPPAFGFGAGIDIPAGESRYVVKDSFVLPVGVDAYGARGHAHYLCREMKMTATLPDGSTRGLLWIKDWDFGWQDSYFFKTPFALPKGTRIDTELIYDNSDGNIRNPIEPAETRAMGAGVLRRDGQHDAAGDDCGSGRDGDAARGTSAAPARAGHRAIARRPLKHPYKSTGRIDVRSALCRTSVVND